MMRQARTSDTGLNKRREMTGMSQTLPWLLGGEGVKMTENKIHFPRWQTGYKKNLPKITVKSIGYF
jgi:hypothetical protein